MIGPKTRDPSWALCALGCVAWSWIITSSVGGRMPPESCSLRYWRVEFTWPSNTSFANILALLGGSFLRGFGRRFCITHPLRRSVSISPSFHRAYLLDKHSWWSFTFEPWLGFCSTKAKRTMAAVRAICCIPDLLFQSFMCLATWSIKSWPIFPYGTRKVFCH